MAPAYQTVVQPLSWLSGDDKLRSCVSVLNKTAIKHWEKLARTLSKFVASHPHCREYKNRDFKITFVELFYVVCFQWFGLNWFHKKNCQ